MKDYLSPEEIAEKLGVKSKSVRQWLREGKLKGVKAGRLWRVSPEAFQEFLGIQDSQNKDSLEINEGSFDYLLSCLDKDSSVIIKVKNNHSKWVELNIEGMRDYRN